MTIKEPYFPYKNDQNISHIKPINMTLLSKKTSSFQKAVPQQACLFLLGTLHFTAQSGDACLFAGELGLNAPILSQFGPHIG